MDHKNPEFPQIGNHPEAVQILRDLGAGRIQPNEAYDRLLAIVSLYMWPEATDAQAQIIGRLICYMTHPGPDQNFILRALQTKWELLTSAAPSAYAYARAVEQLNRDLGFEFIHDREVAEGNDRLFHEILRTLSPPRGVIV